MPWGYNQSERFIQRAIGSSKFIWTRPNTGFNAISFCNLAEDVVEPWLSVGSKVDWSQIMWASKNRFPAPSRLSDYPRNVPGLSNARNAKGMAACLLATWAETSHEFLITVGTVSDFWLYGELLHLNATLKW